MIDRTLLADVIAGLHIIWMIVLGGCAYLQFTDETYRMFFFVMFVVTGLSWLVFGGCPLSLLESYLRWPCDVSFPSRFSFIAYYCKKIGMTVPQSIVIVLMFVLGMVSAFFALINT